MLSHWHALCSVLCSGPALDMSHSDRAWCVCVLCLQKHDFMRAACVLQATPHALFGTRMDKKLTLVASRIELLRHANEAKQRPC
jgi:hypothetical protein